MLVKDLVYASRNSMYMCFDEWMCLVAHVLDGGSVPPHTQELKLTSWWKYLQTAFDAHEDLLLQASVSVPVLFQSVMTGIKRILYVLDRFPVDFSALCYETQRALPAVAAYLQVDLDENPAELHSDILRKLLDPPRHHRWYLGFLMRSRTEDGATEWIVSDWGLNFEKCVVETLFIPRTKEYLRTVGTLSDCGGPVEYRAGRRVAWPQRAPATSA